jgi:C4-dicarboxylate transporter DctM subunit
MTLILIALFFVLVTSFGIPIFITIGGIALLGFIITGGNKFESSIAVIQELYKIAENPIFITIPLFTFAGYMMAESKTSTRLINLSRAFLGWMPGSLAIVALFSCSFFTVFTGASGVTIIALGGLLFPSLMKENYPEKFSLGILTIGGSRGITFPPSLPLILFGVIASMSMQNIGSEVTVSVDKLFVAGAIPGILELTALSIFAMIVGTRAGVVRTRFSLRECVTAVREAAWEIPIPLIILLGIYGGYFTASEAASVVAFYVFIVETFIYRDIHFKNDLPRIIKESMVLIGGIFIIIGAAFGLTNFLVDQEVPTLLLDWTKKFITSKVSFLLLLNVFLLVVGALLDVFASILVVLPLIIPIALEYGINPVHLGIIFLLNLEIAYSTPPLGLNLFIASFRFNRPIISLYMSTLPFLGIMVITLMMITYIPALSLTLLEPDKTKGFLIIGGIVAIFILAAIALILFEKKVVVVKHDPGDIGNPTFIEDQTG